MVFFDIDDTLRVKDTGYMPESIQRVFKALKAKGILVGIASGRARYGVPQEVQDLHADYCVKLNGAYVKDDAKNIIFQAPIPADVVVAYKNGQMRWGFTMEWQGVMKQCYPPEMT